MELKGNKAPVDIVKLTFDGLLLLMGHKVTEVKVEDKLINKVSGTFIKDRGLDAGETRVLSETFLIQGNLARSFGWAS